MNQMTVNTEPATATERTRASRTGWVRWLLPLVFIGAGLFGGAALFRSGPQVPMTAPSTQPRIVAVATFAAGTHTPIFEAMGTVVAAHESTLYPMVSGPVVAVSDQLMPGGRLGAGEEILRIDEEDYQLNLRKNQASVAEAQAALQEELGQQEVAKREYELLERDLEAADRALVLREPQLASARATLASAVADRDQAELDLARTRVTAPFDGMVLSRNVDLGTRVTTSTELLTLVNVDTFWVEASVPVDALARIAIPVEDGDPAAQVELGQTGWDSTQTRRGRVLRLIPELDSDSRTARLLVEIDDPLGLRDENAGLPPIMVNDYLRVQIAGEPIPDVVKLPRNLLRNGDTVWIMDADNRLEIRPVDVVHKADEYVLVESGIADDDRIITVNLSTPVAGTLLQLNSTDAEELQRFANDDDASRPGTGT